MSETGDPSLDDSWFDEHDLHELDQMLQNLRNSDALKLDATQALLCALAIGPKPLSPEIWLPAIVGEQPTSVQPDQFAQLCQRLVDFSRFIENALDYHSFEPIFSEQVLSEDGEETHLDVGGWCQGFSLGVDLLAEDWEKQMHADSSLIEMLSPIVALGVDDGVFSEVADPEIPSLSESEREDLIRHLPNVLADVRDYWRNLARELAQDLATSAQLRSLRQLH
jgi:uncharacterized protein